MGLVGHAKADSDKRRHDHFMTEARSLLGGYCWECYETESLDFDHIDPTTKSFNISAARSIRRTLWLAELTKCQLLCSRCHDFKTAADRGFQYVKGMGIHGTLTAYRYCHCPICKAAHSKYMRGYLASQGITPKRRPAHGEIGMYRKGCRCTLCRAANSAKQRAYRASTT